MSDLLRVRRDELCTMLSGLDSDQWRAETLCSGWDAGDIAAHLVIREREPLTGPGTLIGGPLGALTDSRRAAWKAKGRDVLITALADGPPWPLSGPLANVQLVEDWIHEQDVRRGGANLMTPVPSDELAPRLWGGTKRFATRTLAVDGDAVIELTDGTRAIRLRARRRVPIALPTEADADVVVKGAVGELLLYVTGRVAADVVIEGASAARSLLEASPRTL